MDVLRMYRGQCFQNVHLNRFTNQTRMVMYVVKHYARDNLDRTRFLLANRL